MAEKKTEEMKLIFDRAFDLLRGRFGYSKDQAIAIIDKAVQIMLESKDGDFVTFKDFTDSLTNLTRHKCN